MPCPPDGKAVVDDDDTVERVHPEHGHDEPGGVLVGEDGEQHGDAPELHPDEAGQPAALVKDVACNGVLLVGGSPPPLEPAEDTQRLVRGDIIQNIQGEEYNE